MPARSCLLVLLVLSACDSDAPIGPDLALGLDAFGEVADSVNGSGDVTATLDVPVAPCAGKTCDDGNPCTMDGCSNGGCTHTNATGACDDHNPCTVGDACQTGVCLPGAVTDCNDDVACTVDSCSLASGCTHTTNDTPCEDGKACTKDACTLLGCTHGAAGSNCDDGDICTSESCHNDGTCNHTNIKNKCDDGNACTDDACGVVCAHVNNKAKCTDGSTCTTTDACTNGVCLGGSPLKCDDFKPCTADSCVPATGCAHKAIVDDCGNGKCGCGETNANCATDCK